MATKDKNISSLNILEEKLDKLGKEITKAENLKNNTLDNLKIKHLESEDKISVEEEPKDRFIKITDKIRVLIEIMEDINVDLNHIDDITK